MKIKNLIITRADSNIKEITDITIPLMEEYAKNCNADFKIISEQPPFLTGDNKPHYRILKVRDYLEEYNRVLCLDADMIINKNTPNLFELVPEDKIGSIFEDKGSRQQNRRQIISKVQNEWGDVGWSEGYTNAGTFLLSKQHKDIFLPHEGKYYLDWGSADVHLSYMARKLRFEFFELSYRWNHMTPFSESWNNSSNRFDSFIIHYAGVGVFEKGVKNRIEQIKKDYKKIYD
tara:strand:+ start:2950 stop:3645 length:696 start_codon:yes stop_codon:yes gene_type:complete